MFKTDGEVMELNKSLTIRADRYCRLEWAEMSRKKEPPPGGGGGRRNRQAILLAVSNGYFLVTGFTSVTEVHS